MTIQPLFAQTAAQIMRNLRLPSREEIIQENLNNKTALRELAWGSSKEVAFHVHAPVTCQGTTLPVPDVQKIVDNSKITPDNVSNNPFAFAFMIEVVNAHLDIMRSLYTKINAMSETAFTVRYHSPNELKSYPDTLLSKDLNSTLKSAYYIRYVIFPVLNVFMTSEESDKFKQTMGYIISAPEEYRNINAFDRNINILRDILSKIFIRHLKSSSMSVRYPVLIIKTINQLYYHAWLAYKNTQSCPYFSRIIDPSVPAYYTNYTQAQGGYDEYQIGYGLYNRARFLTYRYILKNENLSEEEKNIIQENLQNFSQIYNNITMFNHKNVSLSQLMSSFEKTRLILLQKFQ